MVTDQLFATHPAVTKPASNLRRTPIVRIAAAAVVLILGLGACASEAASTPQEIGEAMVTAFDDHDADTALDLLEAGAVIEVFSASTPEEFRELFGWFDALDWRFDSLECTASGAEQVTCRVLQRNEWSKVVDADPVNGDLEMTVADGQITSLAYTFDVFAWIPVTFEPFSDFVAATHPADMETMWYFNDDGGIRGPRLTEDSIALFDQYSEEYAAAVADDG